jgi:hypothetical protein
MQTSFLRKTVVANEQNSIVPIPSEWYGTEIEIIAFPVKIEKQNASNVQDDKQDILNSFLKFADNNRVFEKDFHFDREACYDR